MSTAVKEILNTYNKNYSTVDYINNNLNTNLNNLQYSKTTDVSNHRANEPEQYYEQILKDSFSDIIPYQDAYYPFYVKAIKEHGLVWFTNAIKQCRIQGGTVGLLNWFIKNPSKIRLTFESEV